MDIDEEDTETDETTFGSIGFSAMMHGYLAFNEKDEPAVIAQAVAKLGYDLSEEDNGKNQEDVE